MDNKKEYPIIYGINHCSDTGPDVFATCVFLSGCNLRCPYCMNQSLVNGTMDKSRTISLDDVKTSVADEGNEWFIISGGEPTLSGYNKLINLIHFAKDLECKVGLSTNGMDPMIIKDVIVDLDYISLDIKTSSGKIYESIGGKIEEVLTTLEILRDYKKEFNYDFNYEVRTTLYPPFIDRNALSEIAGMLSDGETWTWQQFRIAKKMLSEDAYLVIPFSEETIESYKKEIVEKNNLNLNVRYV